MKTPIFGSFGVSRSTNLAANQCINLYPEIVETKQGKAIGALYGTPGLTLFATCGAGPVMPRGLHVLGNLMYAIAGGVLYKVTAAGIATAIGPVPTGQAWLYTPSTGALAAISLPFPIAVGDGKVNMIDNGNQLAIFYGVPTTQQDGFGLAAQPGSNLLWQSDLLDLSSWGALNFASADGNPDPVVGLMQTHREIFVVKQTSTEIWTNQGNPGFAFQRLDGVFIEAGAVSSASIVKVGEGFMWLGQNAQGQGIVIRIEGFNAKRVSTFELENQLAQYPTLADADAYAYQQGGHTFYVVSFPGGNASWAYDATVSDAIGPAWHQRAEFVTTSGLFGLHPACCSAPFNGATIVGDRTSGNLYTLDLANLTDNGAQRKWLRSWRALPQPTDDPVRMSSLRIDMQTGIDVPDGANPQVMLRWSDDGAHTWSRELFAAAGPPGATAQRVKFNRLGSTRRNHGLDRIFELSSSDIMPAAIIGAELT